MATAARAVSVAIALLLLALSCALPGRAQVQYAIMDNDALNDDAECRAFVRASLSYQRDLADKVKQANGRRVYLFDASGFSADFEDAVLAAGSVRYKTGVLAGGLAVDAVLSVSAHRALGEGAAAARTYRRWTGRTEDTLEDDHGVYV